MKFYSSRLPLLIIALPAMAAAQDYPSDIHQSSATPSNARYEIVQSQLAAKWTFRLDRFTGRVALYVSTEDDRAAWEEMPVEGLPAAAPPLHPRYQIFTSGLAAKHTLLINTDTGASWRLITTVFTTEDGQEKEIRTWAPFRQ